MKGVCLALFCSIVGVSLYAQPEERVTLMIGGNPWVFDRREHVRSGWNDVVALPGSKNFIKIDHSVQEPPKDVYDAPNRVIDKVTALKSGTAKLQIIYHPGTKGRASESKRIIVFDIIDSSKK